MYVTDEVANKTAHIFYEKLLVMKLLNDKVVLLESKQKDLR